MDRKAWIAITLSVVGLVGWQWYVGKYITPAQQAAAAAAAASASPAATAAPAASAPAATATPGATTAAATPPQQVMTARAESLTAGGADFVFNNDAGGIEQVILLSFQGENQESVSLNRDRGMPIGALGFNPGEVFGGFEMSADRTKGEVTFSKTAADGLEITKRFVLPAASDKAHLYTVNLEVSFRNPGKSELQVPAFFVGTGGAAPSHVTDQSRYTCFRSEERRVGKECRL